MKQGLFSSFYDSTNQRNYNILSNVPYLDDVGVLTLNESFKGRIRLDSLIHNRLVITDTQLLDGHFFQEIGYDGILSASRRKLDHREYIPITVRSRSEKLEDALVMMIKSSNQKNLYGFSYSLLDEKERAVVASEFKKIKSKYIKNWKNIPELIKDVCNNGNNSKIDKIKDYWEKVIKATARTHNSWPLIKIEKWNSSFNNVFHETIKTRFLEKCFENDIEKEFIKLIQQKGHLRSIIEKKYQELCQTLNHQNKKTNILTEIYVNYNSIYNESCSIQHGCSFYESIYDNKYIDTVLGENLDNSHTDSTQFLVNDFLFALSLLPDEYYIWLFKKNEVFFNKWWGNRDIDSLKNALGNIVNETIKEKIDKRLFHKILFVNSIMSVGLSLIKTEYLSKIIDLATKNNLNRFFSFNYRKNTIDNVVERILYLSNINH